MHRNIQILRWFNFFTDFRLYSPVAILYFTQVSGSFALGMAVFSLIMLSSALFEVPTGIFSDKIGRKQTVTYGAIASVTAVVFYALGGSFILLAVGAIFEGLARSFYSGNNDALLHDTLSISGEEELFGEISGKISVMNQIALALSALLGALLASWSFTLVIWISVIPQLLCVACSFLLLETPKIEKQSGNVYTHFSEALRLFFRNPRLRLLSITDMLNFSFSESTYNFQAAFYQTVWPLWALGIAKALSNIGAAIGFQLSGKFLRKYNSFKLLIYGYTVRRTVTILGALFPTVFSPFLMISSSFPWAVTATAQGALLQKEFDSTKRATMASLNSLGGSILFGVFSISLGMAADFLSPRVGIILMQSISLIVLFFYWTLFSHSKRVS